MPCCKSLLILPFICVLCPFVSLNVTNETNNNIRLNNIHTSNTRDLNISVELRNETLSQSYSECDCGENSISCTVDENGANKCNCKDGYVPQITLPKFEIKCSECNCGKGAISCELNILKFKKCTCRKGYATYRDMFLPDEECKECDCGIGEISCEINKSGRRKCSCGGNSIVNSSGYNEKCEKCSCGPNSVSCQMVYGSKKCKCKAGYVVKRSSGSSDEKCALPDKECSCGFNSISCKMVFGRKVCTCISGYVVKKASWSSDDECALPDSGKLWSPTSTWRILTYVVLTVYAFIIITFLAVICLKRKNMRSR